MYVIAKNKVEIIREHINIRMLHNMLTKSG